ncbi:hypothetical protein LSH36_51g00052 [Paralvinella palmiformis]|uniref:TRADD-like N-terminal domain-containing protein n=1 Tax=Paralvinella palmiformis TaxID=53620 RepID=A0AAD9K600_9ANNE|nr:hypothetical protein LSH36_51g00052 [Paralvinella palmiformis]
MFLRSGKRRWRTSDSKGSDISEREMADVGQADHGVRSLVTQQRMHHLQQVKADPVTEYIEKTSVQTGNDPTPTKTCPKCEAKDQTLKRSNIPCQGSNSVCLGHSLAPSEANLLRKRNSAAWQTCDLEHPGPSTVHESPSGGHQTEVNDSRPGPSKRRCLANDRPSCVGDGSNPVSVAAQCVKHCVSKRSCSKKRHSYAGIPLRQSERLKKRHSTGGQKVNTVTNKIGAVNSQSKVRTNTKNTEDVRKKVTCDIRLRVRAEYCSHESALQGNIHSNKPELIEQQFEKFMQANTILKSRDLGSIICDIKFSDLTYLDAFWRDYINGSLLEALKGVFITETLKQAVGHEAIKLMVNVDEDDYESGRLALLKNLQHHR